jgi:competence protein ComEA
MPVLPTKRLLVYFAAGIVVLAVGAVGLWSMRDGGSTAVDGVVIQANGTPAVSDSGVGTAADGATGGLTTASTTSSTSTTILPKIWVQVAGAVRRPGVYQVEAGARAFEAVLAAGGFAESADQQAVALAAKLVDGCRVYVPEVGGAEAVPLETPSVSSTGISGGESTGSGGSTSSGGAAANSLVSLNSATLEELDALPGVGPALAQQIITYREQNGPFMSIEQLDEVPGIGPAKLEQLRPLIAL